MSDQPLKAKALVISGDKSAWNGMRQFEVIVRIEDCDGHLCAVIYNITAERVSTSHILSAMIDTVIADLAAKNRTYALGWTFDHTIPRVYRADETGV